MYKHKIFKEKLHQLYQKLPLQCNTEFTVQYRIMSNSHWYRRPAAVELWQHNAGWYSIPSDQADAVGDDFCCSACVLYIEVRLHHATPDIAAQAEGAGANQV